MPIFHFPFFYNPNFYPKKYRNYTVSTFTDRGFSTPNLHNNNFPVNAVGENSNVQISKNIHTTQDDKSDFKEDAYFFELFGLKLYLDDILLLCLIFFLYEEGVKDEELFLSLILLLLS